LKVGDELGGHIVTGHVDGIGHLVSASREGDSIRLVISAPAELAAALAAKGSITLDGISLTVNSVEDQPDGSVHFGLNIIPHTAIATTLDSLPDGRAFNLEIDVLARYLDRMQSLRSK
jgi:riboflavin synthase